MTLQEPYLQCLYPLLDNLWWLQRIHILQHPLDHLEALKYVHDIINSSSLNTQYRDTIL